MANYKETTVSGESWQRCYEVTLINSLSGVRKATFSEEKVVSVNGQTIKMMVPGCSQTFDPNGSFVLLDPETGAQTGTMTHAQMFAALYSLYMDTAIKRDADPQKYSSFPMMGI